MANDMYIVIWMERKLIKGGSQDDYQDKEVDSDHYQVFIDGNTSEENEKTARAFYESKKEEENTYSCNLCMIIKSTDYL